MIYLGSDHRGYEMKEKIKAWLAERGIAFEDCGPDHFDKDDDYPEFAANARKKKKEINKKIITAFLHAKFSDQDRYINRVKKVIALEK